MAESIDITAPITISQNVIGAGPKGDDGADGTSGEGTTVLSTGEVAGKVLTAQGDGSSAWGTVAGSGDALTSAGLDQFAATTLAELNTVVSEDVVGTSDSRLSDARTPTAHNHTLSDVTDSGTAAAQNVGTAAGDVVQMIDSGGAKLPAVDGSLLTGISAGAGALDDLTDVDTTGKASGDHLSWNGTSWTSEAPPTGGTVDFLSNFATASISGRVTAGSGNSEELTPAQVRTLINVEDGATGDQTGAQIKTAYEGEANTNAFTDAEKTNLGNQSGTNTGDQTTIAGITGTKAQFDTAVTDGNVMYVGDAPTSHNHTLADITDSGTAAAQNVGTAAGDVVQMINSGGAKLPAVDGSLLTGISGGAGALDDLTDVDTTGKVSGDHLSWNGSSWTAEAPPTGGTVDFLSNFATASIAGRVTAGSGNSEELTAAQVRTLINVEDGATGDQTGAQIKTAYEAETNAFTDAQFTKLAGIETAATADQTGAEIKAAYEAELNAFTDAQFTKLSGIETGATGDQTGAEIKVAYEGEANTNAFTDAEKTNLGNQSGTNTGDQTTIAGITGTKAQFDTAVTDGNIMYVGDAPTAHNHTLSAITDITAVAEEINYLDFGANGATNGQVLVADGAGTADWQIAPAGVLADLTDVNTVGKVSGDHLSWNGTNWVAETPAAGGTVDFLSNVATSVICGRTTAGSGNSEELTPAQARTLLNVADGANAYAGEHWYTYKLGDETTAMTTGIKTTIILPAGGELHGVHAGSTTAATGSSAVIDVHKNGVTVLTNKITIEATESDSLDATTQPSLTTDPTTFIAGDKIEIEVDTAPTGGCAGAHANLLIKWT